MTTIFEWKCREPGCKAVFRIYAEYIHHLVDAHGLLKGVIVIDKARGLDVD